MLKNITILFFVSLFLNSCGYTPMFSSNNQIVFNFKEINVSGDNELGNLIKSNLKSYNNIDAKNELILDVNVVYNKTSQTKDGTGKTTDYLLTADVQFIVKSDTNEKQISISKDSVMKNLDKEFEEKKYERTIKQNFSYSIVNKLIMQLSKNK
jgi:hypothetical protein